MTTTTPITLNGFLRIREIPGEAVADGHEDEIVVHRLRWSVAQAGGTALRGLRRARADVGPLVLDKWLDAASPYLALAAMRGTAFDEAVLTLRKDTGDTRLDYLVITLKDVVVSQYEMLNEYTDVFEPIRAVPERVSLGFETISYRYVEQNEDGSAGDEHEIEYDVVSGT